jgi:hypothetical protein
MEEGSARWEERIKMVNGERINLTISLTLMELVNGTR